MSEVYINSVAKYLPNEPVANEQIEQILGVINNHPSRARSIVLRNNQIKSRYYAIDKAGNPSHSNAELTQQAVLKVLEQVGTNPSDIDLLSCGTSTPDQFLPSHASMVHGLLENKPIELNSAMGICTSGMNALKYAYMAVASKSARTAVCTGSEKVSSWLRADKFQNESEKLAELEQNPIIAFEKDFLRWMLSDGAGAMLLSDKPNPDQLSLKIHWVDGLSYANELEACMYAGMIKEDGVSKFWSDLPPNEWLEKSVFAIKQDIKLLESNIIKKGVESMSTIIQKQGLAIAEIDHFLPHISSFFFKDRLHTAFEEAGMSIPLEKWFINLDRVGNVGAASIYIQLEELFHSGKLQPKQKVLLSVPESGRFSYVYALLEVV